MKLKLLAATAAAVTMMGLTGCAGMSDRQTLGTAGGAAAGGLIGNKVLGGTLGTLGGAAAGGYLGNRATDPAR